MKDDHTSIGTHKRPEGFYVARQAAKIGAAAVLVATIVLAALSGCQGSDSKPSQSDNNEAGSTIDRANESLATITESEVTVAVTETTAIPETQPLEEIDYDVFPEDVAEGYSFERALSEEQQETISTYNDMSLEEFRALPESEQLIFAYWIFENYKPRFDLIIDEYAEALKSLGRDEKPMKYTYKPTTADEFADNRNYLINFVLNIYVKGESSQDTSGDIVTAKKCAVLLNVYDQQEYEYIDTILKESGGQHQFQTRPYTEATLKEENGQIIVTTSLASADGGETEYYIQEYIYNIIEFKDIHGNSISFNQCVFSK